MRKNDKNFKDLEVLKTLILTRRQLDWNSYTLCDYSVSDEYAIEERHCPEWVMK